MTENLEGLETTLSDWCKSYVGAFSAYDAEGISAHWAFPALIMHEGARMVFESAEHFTKNTAKLLSFYKRQGVARAERALISFLPMWEGAASMRVHDVMLNVDSEPITEWEAAYMLQKIDGAWRAVCAVSDGEAAAWRARGTPLGS